MYVAEDDLPQMAYAFFHGSEGGLRAFDAIMSNSDKVLAKSTTQGSKKR